MVVEGMDKQGTVLLVEATPDGKVTWHMAMAWPTTCSESTDNEHNRLRQKKGALIDAEGGRGSSFAEHSAMNLAETGSTRPIGYRCFYTSRYL